MGIIIAADNEEFHESDVIFAADHDHRRFTLNDYSEMFMAMSPVSVSKQKQNSKKKNSVKKRKMTMNLNDLPHKISAVPIKIPETVFRYASDDGYEFEEDWEREEMVPPHVIIGRRVAGKMAFSVCTGNGRTLKGRDLSEVRNSILRMTGFLET